MMNLNTVQTGLHTVQIGMMKGKTMAIAACISVCMLGAEAVFVPMAMNSSYERYETKQAPKILPVNVEELPAVKVRPARVELKPIKKRGSNSGDDNKAPVS